MATEGAVAGMEVVTGLEGNGTVATEGGVASEKVVTEPKGNGTVATETGVASEVITKPGGEGKRTAVAHDEEEQAA